MATYECERLAANRDHDKIIFDIKGDISFDIDVNGATIRTIKINKPYIPLVVRIPSSVQYNGRNYPVLSVEGFSYFPGKYEKITDKRKKDFDKWVFTGKYSDHKSPASIFHRYEEAGRYKAPCIVEVILPNTIQTIGDKAFSDLESLDIIHIPKETLSIGAEAFKFCRGLKTCTIPKSVKKIGACAFEFTFMKELIIKNKEGVVEFGDRALDTVKSVKYTGKGLFSFLK